MRRLTFILIVIAFFAMASASSYADAGTANVTVSVAAVDRLTIVDGNGTINLNANAISADTSPGPLVSSGSDTSSSVKYVHNSAADRKITAEVTASPVAISDISLTIVLPDGNHGTSSGSQTIYNAGSVTAAQDVVTAITRGGSGLMTITFDASANAENTNAGNYPFVITLTTLDD